MSAERVCDGKGMKHHIMMSVVILQGTNMKEKIRIMAAANLCDCILVLFFILIPRESLRIRGKFNVEVKIVEDVGRSI